MIEEFYKMNSDVAYNGKDGLKMLEDKIKLDK